MHTGPSVTLYEYKLVQGRVVIGLLTSVIGVRRQRLAGMVHIEPGDWQRQCWSQQLAFCCPNSAMHSKNATDLLCGNEAASLGNMDSIVCTKICCVC